MPLAIVPFSLIDDRIVVRLLLDGKGPFTFVLDSGAGNTTTPQVVAELGLQTHGSFTISGTGAGTETARHARIAQVALGTIGMTDQEFTVVSLDDVRKSSGLPAFDGLIGAEFFSKYVVRIDAAAQTLAVYDPRRFTYTGAGMVFTVTGRGIPQVAASVDGIAGQFTVDTGDRFGVTLMEPTIARDHVLERYDHRVKTITGWGIGGPVPGYVTRAGELELGTVTLVHPLLRLPTVDGGFFASARLTGSIGMGVAEHFTMIFDYPHKRLIFEDPRLDDGQPYDRSGLWLNSGASGFDVAAVAEGSPAASAGLREGDAIVAVDGVPSAEIPLADLRARLRGPAGTRIAVTVAHDGERRNVELVLQDLV